jgi:hypothetical protein
MADPFTSMMMDRQRYTNGPHVVVHLAGRAPLRTPPTQGTAPAPRRYSLGDLPVHS